MELREIEKDFPSFLEVLKRQWHFLQSGMSKTKSIIFIIVGAMAHFGLTFALILQRISCDIQPHCISLANEVGVTMLGFPPSVITKILYPDGVRANGWFYILLPLNSLAAVTIIWFALVKPIIKTARRKIVRQSL